MSDSDQLDLLLGVYADPALAAKDFGAFVRLVENRTISTDGIMLVSKSPDGEVIVQETHDHVVRKNVKRGARAGLILSLFAPLLLGVTVAGGAVVGGLAGEFARRRVSSGVGDKLGDAMPAGLAGIVAIYDHADAGAAESALLHAVRTSCAPIDEASPTTLKAGLKEARAGLAR